MIKKMIFRERGAWSQSGYRATIALFNENGALVKSFMGSTWANPYSPKDPSKKLNNAYGAICSGNYNAEYSEHAHNGRKGFNIEENGRIPTIAPNPNQNGQSFADHIDIHAGWSATWRGSAGCLTIKPEEYDTFCSYFNEGDQVMLEVIRDGDIIR